MGINMTLEYITFCIEETIRACDIDDPYDEGYQDALCWVSELLEQLEPSWHEYPKEQPKEDTWVLVTFEDGRIEVDHFYCGKFVWWPSEGESIIAWTELPKKYVKKDDNEH